MKKHINLKSFYENNLDGWVVQNIDNKSGNITIHFDKIKNQYNLKCIKEYLAHFKHITKEQEGYLTEDGKFYSKTAYSHLARHITKVLKFSIHDYVKLYPHMEEDLKIPLKAEKYRAKKNGEDAHNLVQSPFDGKYYRRLGYSHLKKYGYNNLKEFHKDYPNHPVCSVESKIHASNLAKKNNFKANSAPINISKKEVEIINSFLKPQKIKIQHFIDGKKFDFFFEEERVLVELDNDFHHCTNLIHTTFSELKSYINDVEKYDVVDKNNLTLVSVDYNDVKNVTDFDKKKLFRYATIKEPPKIPLKTFDIILTKDYLKDYRSNKGTSALDNEIISLHKLIMHQMPEFRCPDTNETVEEVMDHLRHYNYNIRNEKGSWLVAKAPTTGSSLLKSIFLSFWKANKKGMRSIVEAWKDQELMMTILRDRCGINERNECYGISINNIIANFILRKFTVSWFKPGLAAAIFKDMFGDVKEPVLVDPCAGFGARMLGFYSVYPNGEYMGFEPNTETFNELKNLSKMIFKSPVLINGCFEDNIKWAYDNAKIFTSIPYWDEEIYSENHLNHYRNEEDWYYLFIKPLKKLFIKLGGRINMSAELRRKYFSEFEYDELILNSSPLGSGENEVIIKL